ncbi:MAG: type IV pilus assembly protein PilM [Patescibacteria group bacterium]
MFLKWVLNAIPIPDYLSMPAIGIDLSDRSLKFVQFSQKRGNLTVSGFGSRIIPKGFIESGEIHQKENFIKFLKSLKKELKINFINVALPEEKAFLSRIVLPFLKEEEIRDALELQLEEHIPLSVENAIFDFEIIGMRNNNSLLVNLSAMPKNLIENYRDVFVAAGMLPLTFEIESQALARAVIPQGNKESVLLIDFGAARVTSAIIENNKIHFTSTIHIGGDDLTLTLSKDLSLDFSEAEEIKRTKGLIKKKGNEKIFDSLLPIIAAVKDEIKKHILYWDSRMSGDEESDVLKKIIICGGGANLLGLPEYLSYELKLPVERANPWVNIVSFEEKIPEIEYKESLIYATALGLVLKSL